MFTTMPYLRSVPTLCVEEPDHSHMSAQSSMLLLWVIMTGPHNPDLSCWHYDNGAPGYEGNLLASKPDNLEPLEADRQEIASPV